MELSRKRTTVHNETIVSDERTHVNSRYVITQVGLWGCCCLFFIASVAAAIFLIVVLLRGY